MTYTYIYHCLQDVYKVVERIETLSHQLRHLARQEATRQRGIYHHYHITMTCHMTCHMCSLVPRVQTLPFLLDA